MNIRYSFDSVPTLRRFAQSDAFIRAIVGPFGSGKSSVCVVEIIRRGQAQRPGPDGVRRTRWVVIRNTYGELKDTTINTVFQWLPPHYFGRYYVADRRYVITTFKGCEIEILFRALDDPEDVKKLLSLELTGAWVNEAREVPWPVIEALQGRLGRYPAAKDGGCTWFGMWLDTNPPDTDSRFYKFFEEEEWQESFQALQRAGVLAPDMKPTDFVEIFHQPSGLADNAENLPNLPKGYYQILGIGKKPEWVKVYIHGRYGFVSDDKAIFPSFNELIHVKAMDPIPGRVIERGWDFGLTPACAFSQLLPTNQWLIFDEMVSEDMSIDTFADDVLDHGARSFNGPVDYEDTGDPAGEQKAQTDARTCFEILNGKGIAIAAGLQSLAIRLESIRRPLRTLVNGEPQFILHPRCKILRKGFLGGYHFKRLATNAERYSSKPNKNEYSHPMDALEYTGTKLFGAGLVEARDFSDPNGPPPQQRSMAGRSTVTGY